MSRLKTLVVTALLGGASFYLMFAIEFPLPLLPNYLKYDPGDVPALLGAFALGPWAGLAIELIKNVLFFLSGKSSAGLIGVSANFLAGATLVLTAGIFYRWRHDLWGALAGLSAGTVVTTGVMTMANYYVFLPLWGVPRHQLLPLLTAAIIPFNLAKGVLSSLVTVVLYRRVEVLLGRKEAWNRLDFQPESRSHR